MKIMDEWLPTWILGSANRNHPVALDTQTKVNDPSSHWYSRYAAFLMFGYLDVPTI